MRALVERYLAVRHAAGFELVGAAGLLRSFAAFCERRRLRLVRRSVVVEWAKDAPSPEQRDRRLAAVRQLAIFAAAEDSRHEVPSRGLFGGRRRRRPPRIFSPAEISRLLSAADQLGLCASMALTLRVLLGLLACTGLRISEALRLRLRDLTADGLHIRETKFKKSRLVPLHPSARAALEGYLRARPPAPEDSGLFLLAPHRPLRRDKARALFLRACAREGLIEPGRPLPRLHDLRHTFAVRSLERCRAGRDAVDRHLLALTTYLGHSCVADTYWYLQATPELMRDIAQAIERHSVTGGGL